MVKGKGGDESAEGVLYMMKLVSWSLTSLFSTNMAISETNVHDEKQRPRTEPWGTPQEEV